MTMSREQYVLDYSNKEVRDCVYGMMKNILDNANIEYIKWDMNRQLTEVGSTSLPKNRQRELWHRYVLGVYDLMNRLTTDYPHILLENCSGGGARLLPGFRNGSSRFRLSQPYRGTFHAVLYPRKRCYGGYFRL